MSSQASKPRIAIVSPFVDKRHGTERCLAEQIERLAGDYEIHLFSSRAQDTDLTGIVWHRVWEIPGPHLTKYLWWFFANHFCRWQERRRTGRAFDLVYSPGINCLDADAILVHHVFGDQFERLGPELRLRSHAFRNWPRLFHRRLYYRLIGWLEHKIYPRRGVLMAAVSQAMATDLERRFRPGARIPAIYHGVDTSIFNPVECHSRRASARALFGFHPTDVVALFIGNDWAKKGLSCLIDALANVRDLRVRTLVVGGDTRQPYIEHSKRLGIADRFRFTEPNRDVIQFFAAADLYVAPSLYDPFGLPVLEAMACGLPVIASRAMGAAELITDGVDGLLLSDCRDASNLARLIRQLVTDASERTRLGTHAAVTAQKFTWDANAEQLKRLFAFALDMSSCSEGALR